MKIAKYPFAILVAALFTVALTTPISSFTNIIWLSSMNLPINFFSSLEIILFDFQRLGTLLYGIIIIEFVIAFSLVGLIQKYVPKTNYLYPIAGAFITGLTLFLLVEFSTQTEVLAGNRTILGKFLHCLAGFAGGYLFNILISRERKISFVIRTLGIIYAYLILGLVLNWIFTPISAASDFGFIFNELNSSAQNALLRDFTSFFVATFLFSIIGVITLNSAWFFSAGIIYVGAGIFNLIAIYAHGTDYNQIFIGEFLLGSFPIALGLITSYQKKKAEV